MGNHKRGGKLMNLMEQCRIWNEQDEYQKIIDAIEQLHEEDRTSELTGELARAYNNFASANDKEYFRKAITLLESIEEEYHEDHTWNFRMAYAYFYLDREELALAYFGKALDALPGDEDTLEYIEICKEALSSPRFDKPFAKRVQDCWEAFVENEKSLRGMMDTMKESNSGEALLTVFQQILDIGFETISFELGVHGNTYELTLTPEGDIPQLFKLVYFKAQAPASIQEHWNIVVGRECTPSFALRAHDQVITGDDVLVWITQCEGVKHISIELYCEKLLPLLKQNENHAWWMLSTLVDQMLGEIPAMDIIQGFDILDTRKEQDSISLSMLKETLLERGFNFTKTAEQFLEENYTMYEMEPTPEEDADLRYDIYTGSNRLISVVQEYYEATDVTMNSFHQDGAVCGSFYYPLDCFRDEVELGKAILDFRDELEARILESAGAQAITFLGGSSGYHYGYLDFIAWDLNTVLERATQIFKDTPLSWASFHTLRRGTDGISLMDRDNEQSDQEDPSKTGGFVGFALLSKPTWDKTQFIQDMKEEWNIIVHDDVSKNDTLVFEEGDMLGAVSLLDYPIPNQEAEENARNNYMWEEAEENARTHQAHLMVATLGKETSFIEKGKLFVKIMAVCCKQQFVTGVFTSGTVFEPEFYHDFADMMKEDMLPVYNWIWFGLYQENNAINAYTFGMHQFEKAEMEVLGAHGNPSDVRDFLSDLVAYVLEADVQLNDGETIGFSEHDKHEIVYSEGVSLPNMTLKITYENTPT